MCKPWYLFALKKEEKIKWYENEQEMEFKIVIVATISEYFDHE